MRECVSWGSPPVRRAFDFPPKLSKSTVVAIASRREEGSRESFRPLQGGQIRCRGDGSENAGLARGGRRRATFFEGWTGRR